jgi:hypothetical protein
MIRAQFSKLSAFLVPVAITLVTLSSSLVRAGDKDDDRESKIKIGFRIAPVPLNLHGKDCELVGYGSYIVNAVSGCNGCHTQSPATQYLAQFDAG